MQDLHPTSTSGDGKPLRDIRRLAPKEPSETLYISCPHCGFLNKTTKNKSINLNGEGTKVITVNVTLEDGSTKAVKEAMRVSGCGLCHHDYTQNTDGKPLFSSKNWQGR